MEDSGERAVWMRPEKLEAAHKEAREYMVPGAWCLLGEIGAGW